MPVITEAPPAPRRPPAPQGPTTVTEAPKPVKTPTIVIPPGVTHGC